ncbi:MAG: phosphatidylserine decarboxylase family protein [Candidatus Binatia bacterium]|nr:phosphatidylserine decarboxylase family protein [Candidatus Binatia bacterium]
MGQVFANDTAPWKPLRILGLPLAREGIPHILATTLLTIVLGLFFGTLGTLFGLLLLAGVVNFFRDPERTPPDDPTAVVAPADGKVIQVADIEDQRFLRAPATRVSIFMSPLDVHVNRIPWGGRVVDVHYNPGKFFRAFADKASLDNEQTAVHVVDTDGHELWFVQIAGFIARRIVCRVEPGDEVVRGQRYGMILFGSRADLYFPAGTAEITVRAGDRTRAGETVVAQWR